MEVLFACKRTGKQEMKGEMCVMQERYPDACRALERVLAKRMNVEAMYERARMTERAASRPAAGKDGAFREDMLARAGTMRAEADREKAELDKMCSRMTLLLERCRSAGDALVLKLRYVDGAERDMVRAMLNLSVSGYHSRRARGLAELQRVISEAGDGMRGA